jgi:hypothetical protein
MQREPSKTDATISTSSLPSTRRTLLYKSGRANIEVGDVYIPSLRGAMHSN